MPATAAQTRYFRALFAQAGVPLSATKLKKFKAMSVGEASYTIDATKAALPAISLSDYAAPHGYATGPQLRYFMKLSMRLKEPVDAAKLEHLKQTTTADMALLITSAQRRLQDANDDHGVPLPAWRLDRGLYDSERVRAGQRAAAERQAARRAEAESRIRARQDANPHKRSQPAYPGEGGHP
jgi:hypothetical protein